mgnify:FL=1
MTETEPTFGLSPEARYYIEQAAEAAATKAVEKLTSGDCPFRCEDIAGVKATLYGSDGKSGITKDVALLEARVGSLLWWNRATVGAALGLIGTLIVNYVR